MRWFVFAVAGISSLLLGALIEPEAAFATHFRFGNVSWVARPDVSPTTVDFTISAAFRRCGYAGSASDGCPTVGDSISELIGQTSLNTGDGTVIGTPLSFEVTAINPIQDWLVGRTIVQYTYAAANNSGLPWVAEIATCCRISGNSGHVNNPDGAYRVQAYVDLSGSNRAPASGMTPLVSCELGSLCQFVVPAVDPDGDALRWRLADGTEAANGFFAQPPGLAVDPGSGLVSWDTNSVAITFLAGC